MSRLRAGVGAVTPLEREFDARAGAAYAELRAAVQQALDGPYLQLRQALIEAGHAALPLVEVVR